MRQSPVPRSGKSEPAKATPSHAPTRDRAGSQFLSVPFLAADSAGCIEDQRHTSRTMSAWVFVSVPRRGHGRRDTPLHASCQAHQSQLQDQEREEEILLRRASRWCLDSRQLQGCLPDRFEIHMLQEPLLLCFGSDLPWHSVPAVRASDTNDEKTFTSLGWACSPSPSFPGLQSTQS